MARQFSMLDAEGAPVVLVAGQPFTSYWQIVETPAEATYSGVAIGERAPVEVGHAWDALDTYDASALARFCITVTDIADPVPEEVTRRQAKLALNAAGLFAAVETIVTAADAETRIWFADCDTWARSDPKLLAVNAALATPLTEEQLDALFVDAAAR